jgi:hypothetical protein
MLPGFCHPCIVLFPSHLSHPIRKKFVNFIYDDCISYINSYHIEKNPDDGMNDFDADKV